MRKKKETAANARETLLCSGLAQFPARSARTLFCHVATVVKFGYERSPARPMGLPSFVQIELPTKET